MERLTIKTPATMSMGFLDTKDCKLYKKLQEYENLIEQMMHQDIRIEEDGVYRITGDTWLEEKIMSL